MSGAERLENLYKLMLGMTLAFFFSYYVWDLDNAGDAAMLAGLGWVACFFWSRNLRKKESTPHG